MNREQSLRNIVRYWMEKAAESIDAANDELKAGRFSFSVNRIYYACFYAASALLLQERFNFIVTALNNITC
jgi:uncharacterized protein (UPF0332 family)